MTTKGHSLKEPSIRLFLNNRHKKTAPKNQKIFGAYFFQNYRTHLWVYQSISMTFTVPEKTALWGIQTFTTVRIFYTCVATTTTKRKFTETTLIIPSTFTRRNLSRITRTTATTTAAALTTRQGQKFYLLVAACYAVFPF